MSRSRPRHLVGGALAAATLVLAWAQRAPAQGPTLSFGLVAAPGSSAPAVVGGTFTELFPPDIGPEGVVAFKGVVTSATDPACGGTCGALFRAEPDVDCTDFQQPQRTFPTLKRIAEEGDAAPNGTYQSLGERPSKSSGATFHRSCFGKTGIDVEAIVEGKQSVVDQIALSGLPCGSQYSSPEANSSGTAYWRGFPEAIVFQTLTPGPPTDLVLPGTPTDSRLMGQLANLAKARSVGWESLPRRIAVSDNDFVAFLSDVTGSDTDPVCIGSDSFCDAAFMANRDSGLITLAAAKNDPLETGGVIARFCGPPAVGDGGVVTFRALTDPSGDCDPTSGSGQGIYVISPPFLPGSGRVVVDGTVPLPDGAGGTITADVFSDPSIAATGAIFFRAGPPDAGAGPAVVIRSPAPHTPTDLEAMARKDAFAQPDQGVFTSFAPAAPSTNRREEVALLTGEGIYVASPASLVVQGCVDAIAECTEEVAHGGYALVRTETKAIQGCLRRILEGRSPPLDCRTEDARVQLKVGNVRSRIARRIERFCSDDIIPLVGACDRNNPTVAGEVSCLITTHAAHVDATFSTLVPE